MTENNPNTERDERMIRREGLLKDIDARIAHLKHACDAIENECESNLAGTTEQSAKRLAEAQEGMLREAAILSSEVTDIICLGAEPLYPGGDGSDGDGDGDDDVTVTFERDDGNSETVRLSDRRETFTVAEGGEKITVDARRDSGIGSDAEDGGGGDGDG